MIDECDYMTNSLIIVILHISEGVSTGTPTSKDSVVPTPLIV